VGTQLSYAVGNDKTGAFVESVLCLYACSHSENEIEVPKKKTEKGKRKKKNRKKEAEDKRENRWGASRGCPRR
jgi:hypothetical protein